MKKAFLILVSTGLALGLSSCGTSRGLAVESVAGMTLGAVSAQVSPDTTFIVQDASPIVDQEPTYDGSQQESNDWYILAACADNSIVDDAAHFEVSVIPVQFATKEVRTKALKHGYPKTVVCQWE